MEYNLDIIDEIRERTGVSYKEAREALDISNGNVLEAIIYIEEKEEKGFTNNMAEKGNELIAILKEMIKKGNVTRILLRKEGDTVINMPVTAGAVGAVLFTPATVAGILVALTTGYKLEIVKDNGEVVDIKDVAEDTISNVRQKVDETRDKFNNKKKDDDLD